jgi:hypothetical protein
MWFLPQDMQGGTLCDYGEMAGNILAYNPWKLDSGKDLFIVRPFML